MRNLDQLLSQKADDGVAQPVLFALSDESHRAAATELVESGRVQQTIDDYKEQQLELFAAHNPSLVYTPDFRREFGKYYADLRGGVSTTRLGNWVFFPWSAKLVHILTDDEFQFVRTSRNRNLISPEEQQRFYNATVGIGGLSVGANIVFALALQGGAKRIKLADMERLALSNTNRILTSAGNVGLRKVDVAARTIYEINPYAQVETFPEGLTDENVAAFCRDLDVMIDELDSFPIKYRIRELCRANRIPILMAADNGDNGVLDIERYDLTPDLPFYNGRLGDDLTYEMFTSLDKFAIGKMITQLVGPENVTERMQQSLLEMGKTIVSWPQLGGAALLNAAAVAYCVRKILNSQPIESTRALLNLDAILDPTHNTRQNAERRRRMSEDFRTAYDLASLIRPRVRWNKD